MTSIIWPLMAWLSFVELPMALVRFRSAHKIYQESKKKAQTLNSKNIDLALFLEQNNSLLRDTTLYKYSFRKMFHIALIVLLSYILTQEPYLLLFLGFAVLGFVQDFENTRQEQYNKISSIPQDPSPFAPAGIASYRVSTRPKP